MPPLPIGVNPERSLFLSEVLAVLARHQLFLSCRLSRHGTCLHFCREPAEGKTISDREEASLCTSQKYPLNSFPGAIVSIIYFFLFSPCPRPFQPFNCAIGLGQKSCLNITALVGHGGCCGSVLFMNNSLDAFHFLENYSLTSEMGKEKWQSVSLPLTAPLW